MAVSQKESRPKSGEAQNTGKAVTNEKECPHIVELAVGKVGLDVELARRIMHFHISRHIKPRHGRIIFGVSKVYYRWLLYRFANGSHLHRTIWRTSPTTDVRKRGG
jgi:hypothetical protein